MVATGDVFSQHGNITLDKIGSVELRDFIRSAALINEDATVKGLTDFQTHVDVENIVVRETINGVDIRKIFKEGIRLSSLHEVTFPRLTVNGNVVFNVINFHKCLKRHLAKNCYSQDTVDASFLNDYDIEDNFDGIVNISKPGTISGHKRVTVHTVNAKDASVNRFNKLPLDFTSTLMFSTNQTVKGNYAAKTITARSIEVRAINGEDLSGFVKIGKTDEVQLVQGSVEMERLTVEAPLRIENRVLNQCNVTEYLDVMAFKQFDSLRIANGTLMIEQPMDSNPLLGKLATKYIHSTLFFKFLCCIY